MAILFQGEAYNDDRMFVLSISRCTVRVDAEILETVIHHEDAPPGHIWCVVTHRNTSRYPVTRVDHFATPEEARDYMHFVEPNTPRISLGGESPAPAPTYDDFSAWKVANRLQEYDYRKMFTPGGANPQEVVLSRRGRRS